VLTTRLGFTRIIRALFSIVATLLCTWLTLSASALVKLSADITIIAISVVWCVLTPRLWIASIIRTLVVVIALLDWCAGALSIFADIIVGALACVVAGLGVWYVFAHLSSKVAGVVSANVTIVAVCDFLRMNRARTILTVDELAVVRVSITFHSVVLVETANERLTTIVRADIVVIADLGRSALTLTILALVHGGADIAVIA